MPEYFFHVTFELYPSRSTTGTTYAPPPCTDIFEAELPVHRRASWASQAPAPRSFDCSWKPIASGSDVTQLAKPRERPTAPRRYSQRTRPSFSNHHDSPVPIVKPPKRAGLGRTQSLAHRDWRFDTISILSIDMSASSGDEFARPRSKSLKQPAQAGGLATKGKFIPSDLKDTEVGWGVVHLYRDGHETPGLYDEGNGAGKNISKEDCTTLCILAVPSYMTPSDFLGFVGELTREDVSHFRLIRTSRANKYMVLMKFREAKNAREWRQEWNGKAFNSMEASDTLSQGQSCLTTAARVLPRRLRQVHQLPERRLEPRSDLIPRFDKRPFCAGSNRTARGSFAANAQRLLARRGLLSRVFAHGKTPCTAYTFTRRTPHLPRLPRAHGRDNGPSHHSLSTRLPLCLSREMARFRLPRMSVYTE
jgi:hypothetical protein